MRDVTDSDPESSSSSLGQRIRLVAAYTFKFLKHPIQEISLLPQWSWQRLFWLQLVTAMISGFIAGLTRPGFFSILAGVVVTPFISTLMVSLLTAFLYYYFQVFEKRTEPAQKIFTLAVFSSIPFFIFQIASSLVPPISLVGFAFSAMLIAVGLSENFKMEKRRAIRLAGILFAVVLVMWLANKISLYRMEKSATSQSTQES